MAGVADHPTRETFLELSRRNALAGGKPMTNKHAGTPISYDNAKTADDKGRAEKGGATTCGCGDTRMMVLTYAVEREIDGVDDAPETITVERRYVACANCDAVHLQPRWSAGRYRDRPLVYWVD